MKKRFLYNAAIVLISVVAIIVLSLPSEVVFADNAPNVSDQWYASESFLNFDAMRTSINALKGKIGDKKITIAVIDTGIITDHEVFDGIDIVSPYNVISDSEDVTDDTAPSSKVSESRKYHGTHVTGTVCQLIKEFGLENNVSVMPIKAGDKNATFAWDRAITAIKYAADNGARVINMSFTNEKKDKPNATYIEKLNEAVNYAYSKGAVCVCAAGNEGRLLSNTYYPAACDKAIGVMAYNKDNEKYSKSNYGSDFAVVAPGENITSAVKDGWQEKSGTSMAAPIVSFIAGVMSLANDSVDEILAAFNEFPSDTIKSGSAVLRKVDLVRLLEFKPASRLAVAVSTGEGEIVSKNFRLDYFSDPTLTLRAELLTLDGDDYVETDGDYEIEWLVSDGTATEKYKGKSIELTNLQAKTYNVSATVDLTSGVLTSTVEFDLKIEYLKVVQKGGQNSEIVQTLGETEKVCFEAYYGFTDSDGITSEYKVTKPIKWKVSRKEQSYAALYTATEIEIDAQQKAGEIEVYAYPDGDGVSEDCFVGTLSVKYKTYDIDGISEAEKTSRSVAYLGSTTICSVGDYRYVDPNTVTIAWYVNGELFTTAKSGEFAFDATESGSYEIVGYVNNIAVVKKVVRVLPTTKTSTWILVGAAVAIAASATGLAILLPKYKKKEKEAVNE